MSTNISKKKREDLLSKIEQIRTIHCLCATRHEYRNSSFLLIRVRKGY